MPVSRRSFVATLGAGATGLIGAPLLTWRGHEALLAQQQQQPQLCLQQAPLPRNSSGKRPTRLHQYLPFL